MSVYNSIISTPALSWLIVLGLFFHSNKQYFESFAENCLDFLVTPSFLPLRSRLLPGALLSAELPEAAESITQNSRRKQATNEPMPSLRTLLPVAQVPVMV